MATVKEINHDSSTTIGDFYTTTVTDPDGAITVTPIAALDSSTNGVEMDYDAGSNTVFLEEDFVALVGNDFRWRFRLDFSNMVFTGSVSITMAQFRLQAAGSLVFRISIGYTGSDISATLAYYSDSGGATALGNMLLPSSGEVCIELRAIKETADGNADGVAEWFMNGASEASFNNLDNFNRFGLGISRTDITFDSGDADATGELYYDEWILDDDNAADLGCGLSSLGLAAMTKPAGPSLPISTPPANLSI
jgi:hypothetical protein